MIVGVEDFAEYMGKADSWDQRRRRQAEVVLEGIQAELEQELGNLLEIVEFSDEEYVLDDSWQGRLYLLHTPVLSVSAVSLDGTPMPTNMYTKRRWGLDDFVAVGPVPVPWTIRPKIVVSYTAGYDGTLYPQIASVIRRAAGREMRKLIDDAVGVDDLSVEGYHAKFSDDVFSDKELKRLQRFRKIGAW